MKRIIILATICFMAFGCDERAIDPLTGKYPVPESIELTTLTDKNEEKLDNGTRVFTVKLNSTEGSFSVSFTADKYYLVPQTYTISETTGNNGTYTNAVWTSNSDGVAAVKSGSIQVKNNESDYEFKGALTLDNGKVIRIHFSGEIIYEKIVEALNLPQLLYASAQAQADGTTLITVKAGTSGLTATSGMYGVTIGGNGNYISIDFVSSTFALAEGTYTPAANGAATAGNYVQGYDTEMWGMVMTNWGSCWFTVVNDSATGIHIENGDITVKKKDNIYTITINNDDVFAEYIGEINL